MNEAVREGPGATGRCAGRASVAAAAAHRGRERARAMRVGGVVAGNPGVLQMPRNGVCLESERIYETIGYR